MNLSRISTKFSPHTQWHIYRQVEYFGLLSKFPTIINQMCWRQLKLEFGIFDRHWRSNCIQIQITQFGIHKKLRTDQACMTTLLTLPLSATNQHVLPVICRPLQIKWHLYRLYVGNNLLSRTRQIDNAHSAHINAASLRMTQQKNA